jgi:type IV pilus assembly protein PilC
MNTNKIFNKYSNKNVNPSHFRNFTRLSIRSSDLTLFSRKLATLVSAGIPLGQALNIISESYPKSPLHFLIQKIKKEIEKGQAFSTILKKYPQHFDKLYCGLIETGELSGTLDILLLRLAHNQEKNEALKRKLKTALFYPIIVLFVALGITAFLLISIVPTFQEMFQTFKLELPLPTKILLYLSDRLRHQGCFLLFALILSGFFSAKLYRSNRNIQHFIQRQSLRLPLFGPLIVKSHVAAFTRILATTENAGVPLSKALETVESIIPNIVFSESIHQVRLLLERGNRLQMAIQTTSIFPLMVNQMITIGEEAGMLDIILEKLSSILDNELETALGQLTTLVEPIMMILLGLMVGGLVIALYLPIFNMGSLF